jgi:uncharacterized membrane protein required for colicin V production
MNILNLFGVLDVAVVLTVIILVIVGWKTGFLLKVIKLASSLFGLIASILLAKPFSTVLDKWFGESIYLKVETYLNNQISNGGLEATEENIREAFSESALPKFVIDWIINKVNSQDTIQSFIDSVSPLITSLILLLIAFVTLFFGSMLLFVLLRVLAKMITSIPVIKQVDKFLGALFGLFKAAVLIFVLFFILGLVISVPAVNEAIGEFLIVDMQLNTDHFRISKWLYDHNILKNIVYIFVAII